MAEKITRLPSGNYRTRVFLGLDKNGKKITKTITGPDKREVAAIAAELELNAKKENRIAVSTMTVGTAIDKYIESKAPVLSPSTIYGYNKLRNSYYSDLENVLLGELDDDVLETYLNNLLSFKTKKGGYFSHKSIRNVWFLLMSAVKKYRSDFTTKISPPRSILPLYDTPNVSGVNDIINAVKGTPLEIPVILAARCGMRASEICGLQWKDITEEHIYVHRTVVIGREKKPVYKEKTKNDPSTRFIFLSPQVSKFLMSKKKEHRPDEYVVLSHGNKLSKDFGRLLTKKSLPHCRFHDLRHAYVSIEHAHGTPDAYIMRQGGWKSTYVLNKNYKQTFDEDMKRFVAASDIIYNTAKNENEIPHEIPHEDEKHA